MRPLLLVLLLTFSPAVLAEPTMAQRMAPCAACHGAEGRATADGFYPRIAGKPAGYLHNQLLNFRDGRRRNALMSYLVDRQRDDYLREMADYFAGLELPYPPPAAAALGDAALARGQALALRGDPGRDIPACVDCHGRKLTGVLPAVPGLVGLPRDYLAAQLGAWQTGIRRAHPPDCMGRIAQRMTAAEIGDVTGWLAAQAVPRDAKPATTGGSRLRDCAP